MDRRYLYITVFVSGMTVLAIELSAARLLGSVFGTSNLVWASIIGLILIYLTAGYFIGGYVADRYPTSKMMYKILAWAAFTAGLVPLIARPVLRMAADAFDQLALGVLFGSFSVVLILFIIPVTLLGMISPFAIRLAIREPSEVGRISGQVYAISTLGSFLGTFLPVLLLIPLIGTTLTFTGFSLFLLLFALYGLWRESGWQVVLRLAWMPLVLILLTILLSGGTIKKTQGQIFEKESNYNYIQVLEMEGYRYLRLNEGQGYHSMWHPSELDFNGPWKQFLVAPFFNTPEYAPENVESMAIIGLAAGTTARQATEVFGTIPIDGFEIDPGIIEVGRQYFDMNLPNLNAAAEDGRLGLAQSKKRYTIIGIDAYRPPYIPWHLTTNEFFELVYNHLTEDGVMVINVGRAPNDRRLIDGLAGTINSIFPTVYVMDLPNSFNSIIYASVQPTEIQNLYANLLYLYTRPDIDPLLIEAIELFVSNQQPTPKSQVIFTDDLAPVEWITNNMVLNFILRGDMEGLR